MFFAYAKIVIMKIIDNDIKANDLKRAYLIYGDETYLIRQYKEKVKKAFFPEEDSMNMTVFEGDDVEPKEIISLADTLPFFADRRLIVVENSGLLKHGGDELGAYIADAPETTHFLFVESEIDKRSKLYKALGKIGYTCEIATQKEETISKWVLARMRRENKNITQQAYQLFIEKTGLDMENIDRELEKLFCYTIDRDVIDVADVEAITTEQTVNKVFDMVEAITMKRQKQALDLYYDLLSLHEAPMRILYLITKQFDQLLVVKSMTNRGESPKQMATTLGKPDWVVKKYQNQCRGFSLQQLKDAVREGIEYETAVKTGQMDDQMAVELFIIQYSK